MTSYLHKQHMNNTYPKTATDLPSNITTKNGTAPDYKQPRRPRAAWMVAFLFTAFLAIIFIFFATLTSMHAPSLRSPVVILEPSISFHKEDSDSLTNLKSQQQDRIPVPPQLQKDPQPQHSQYVTDQTQQQQPNQQQIQQEQQPQPEQRSEQQQQQVQKVQVETQLQTHYIQQQQTQKPYLHPPEDFPHHCYLQHSAYDINASDPYYPFNARSFCLTSSVCVKPAKQHTDPATFYTAASLKRTTCTNVTSSFESRPDQNFDCSRVQDLVYRAHGTFLPPRTPYPPKIESYSSLTDEQLSQARWINGIVFFVPAFPHMGNIFHFSYVAGSVGHIASAIPELVKRWRGQGTELPDPIPVTLMLRGGSISTMGGWQEGIMNLLINQRLEKSGLRISLATMNESVIGDVNGRLQSTQLTCAKSALFLGTRSHINLWPFPSNIWIPVDGSYVPVESVALRKAAYDELNINSLLPKLPSGALTPPPETSLFDLPPKVIGYSRRNYYTDFLLTNKKIQEGTVRVFSDSDEKWFVSMLKNVANKYKFSFLTLQTLDGMSFNDQVKLYSKVGYVTGIHGANLMNAIFMRPFGGLMELFAGRGLQCYIAGANSGLAYYGYNPVRRASGEESGCFRLHSTCWQLQHSRRVVISDAQDHRHLTEQVEKSVARIEELHRQFGHLGGIPVVYKPHTSAFTIDWSKARFP